MIRVRSAALFLLLATLAVLQVPGGEAATTINSASQAAGSSQTCFHHDVGAVNLIVAAGYLDDCAMFGIIERTSTGVNQVTANWNGPIPIGANVITFGATFNGMTGCTGSAWSVTSSNGGVGSSATASATITMTSNDCSGIIELTASIPTTPVFVFRDRYSINIHTPDLASYVFNCGNTGTQADTQNPGLATCNVPNNANYDFTCGSPGSSADARSPATAQCADDCGGNTENQWIVQSGICYAGPPAILEIPVPSGTSATVPMAFHVSIPNSLVGAIAQASLGGTSFSGSSCTQSTSTTSSFLLSGDYTVTNIAGSATLSGSLDFCEVRYSIRLLNAASTTLREASFRALIIRNSVNTALSGTVSVAVAGSLTLSGTLDNLNRLCAASSLGSSCSTPLINLGGTLDILDRLCGASATGTSCNQATVSAILSGTTNTVVSGNLVLSGTLDSLMRLCGASATGTTCNQPTVSAVLSGTLDALTRWCAASNLGTACSTPSVNSNTNTTFVNNGNMTSIFPDTIHLCGGRTNSTSCQPLSVDPASGAGPAYLLLFAALVFAGMRTMKKPLVWIWVLGLIFIILFLFLLFTPKALTLTSAVLILTTFYLLIMFFNRFGFLNKTGEI